MFIDVAKSFRFPCSTLKYTSDDWSIRITKQGCKNAFEFPRVLRLHYSTKSSGRSLMWRNGSNDFRNTNPGLGVSDCVFTSASNINNRSLFPCQEPPIAMATWQAVITTPNSFRSKC